jgi:TraX protein
MTKTVKISPRPLLTASQQEGLKWLALLVMTLDHANKTLWTFQFPLYVVGRLAFPLFVFLLAYNLEVRKVNAQTYVVPQLLVGVISQPIIMTTLGYSWWVWNIMATLFLGLSFQPVRAWLHAKNLPGLLAIPLWFVLGLFVDYGPVGVFLVPMTQWFLSRPSLASASSLLVILLAVNQFSSTSFAPLFLVPLILFVSKLELSLPRVRCLGYWFYPLHLLVLGLIKS